MGQPGGGGPWADAEAVPDPAPDVVRTFPATSNSPPATIPRPAPKRSSRPGMSQPVPEWTGEDGASGHPLMTAQEVRQAAANFPRCVAAMWPDAARRNITAASFRALHGRPDTRSAPDGPDGCAAGIHQGGLGLSRCAGERHAHAEGPRGAREVPPRFSTRSKRLTVSTATRSPRSGAWRRTIRRRPATAVCCARQRRSPASAAVRVISRTSFYPRWKFSTTAICGRSSSTAPGPARSDRRNSCRRPSSASRWTPTATAAATSSTPRPT